MNIANVSASVAPLVSERLDSSGGGRTGGFSRTTLSTFAADLGFFCFFAAKVANGRKNGLSDDVESVFFVFLVSVRRDRGLVPMGQNFTREGA